jgi:hypothetical protein
VGQGSFSAEIALKGQEGESYEVRERLLVLNRENKGKKRSYISADRPAPKDFGLASFKLARTEFSFTGEKELTSTVVGDCQVR